MANSNLVDFAAGIGAVARVAFNTADLSGGPSSLSGASAWVTRNGAATKISTGVTVTVDLGSDVGANLISVDIDAAGLASGDECTVWWSATLSGISVGPIAEAQFSVGRMLTVLTAQGYTSTRASKLDNLDAAVSTRLAAGGYTSPLDAAGIRSAVGLALANLDTQFGAIAGYIDTEVSTLLTNVSTVLTRLGAPSSDVATIIAAIKAKTDNLPAAPAAAGDIPTGAQNADALLDRNLAGGSNGGRTVRDALRPSRNKVVLDGSSATVYQEDDATIAWTGSVTRDAALDTLKSVDPA